MIMHQGQEPLERSGYNHMRKLGFGGKKVKNIHEEIITSMVDSKKGDGKGGADGDRGTSKIISGATYSDGTSCVIIEREGDHKIVKYCKGEKSFKPRKLKMAGFVAFTADYHGPR